MKTEFPSYFWFVTRFLSPGTSTVTGFSVPFQRHCLWRRGGSQLGVILPHRHPRDVWQHLETYLVGKRPERLPTSSNAHDSPPAPHPPPPQQRIWPDTSAGGLEILFRVYVSRCKCAHTPFFCINGGYVPSCAAPLVWSLYFKTK